MNCVGYAKLGLIVLLAAACKPRSYNGGEAQNILDGSEKKEAKSILVKNMPTGSFANAEKECELKFDSDEKAVTVKWGVQKRTIPLTHFQNTDADQIVAGFDFMGVAQLAVFYSKEQMFTGFRVTPPLPTPANTFTCQFKLNSEAR